MVDDEPQTATAKIMRRERILAPAAGATLYVTLTIGTPPHHGLVMFFDFAFSCGGKRHDTDGKIFLDGRSGVCCKRGASLLLFHAQPRPAEAREGAGF